MANESSRLDHLAYVASLYYEQDKNQQEIADELGITRSAVSRLLTEARARGVVEIIVHMQWRTSTELENEIKERFGLRAARVLIREQKSHEMMLRGLGELGADFFTSVLKPSDIVGISWGTALHQMVNSLSPGKHHAAEVVQLIGGTGTEQASADGPLLAPLLANSLGCICRYLHAPLIVENEATVQALMSERMIRETLEHGQQANIALVGIGSTASDLYNPLRLGYVKPDELHELQKAGAVGLVCSRHYDIYGRLVNIPINQRVVGISLADLSLIPYVIGIAGGVRKAEAILGALRGHYINVLITDDTAARRLLEMAQLR